MKHCLWRFGDTQHFSNPAYMHRYKSIDLDRNNFYKFRVSQLYRFFLFFVWISETWSYHFLHYLYSDCPHHCCFYHNFSVVVPSDHPHVYIDLGNIQGIQNRTLYLISTARAYGYSLVLILFRTLQLLFVRFH